MSTAACGDECILLDLTPLFNNDGISYAQNLRDGGFNVWNNTFPAEELPESLSLIDVAGIPFRFPSKEDGCLNNVVCAGQRLEVPVARYDWIYLLTAGERRSEDLVYMHYAGGAVDPEWLRVSDFWPEAGSRFGEIEAFRCTQMHFPRHVQPRVQPGIWMQRLPVPRQEPLAWLHLPDNLSMHIFAATAIKTTRGLRA